MGKFNENCTYPESISYSLQVYVHLSFRITGLEKSTHPLLPVAQATGQVKLDSFQALQFSKITDTF